MRNDCDVTLLLTNEGSNWEGELAPGEVSGSFVLIRRFGPNDEFEDSPSAPLLFKVKLPGSDTQIGTFVAEPSDYEKDAAPDADDSDHILSIGGDICP